MSKEEFAAIAAALHRAYGKRAVMEDDGAVAFWYGMLCDIDYRVCKNAVAQIISQSKFAPSISEIREKCSGTMQTAIPEWDEAWGAVLIAIRRYGYMREQEALDSLPDLAGQIVRRMGYQNLCQSEEISVERANFRDAYKNHAAIFRQQTLIPGSTKSEKVALLEQYVGQASNALTLKNGETDAGNGE